MTNAQALGVVIALFALTAEAAPKVGPIDSPAANPGAMAPRLCRTGSGLCLSWIDSPTEGRHRLRFARLDKGTWTVPVTITESPRLVANWADTPSVARGGDGALVAHWSELHGEQPGAFDVVLARSTDEGRTWRRLGLANDDGAAAEHGFASFVADGKGMLALWLDGRQTVKGGAMTLRAGLVGGSASSVLDARVCDCCGTASAATTDGPIIVYRDRGITEVRDISIVRRVQGKWTEPATVSSDGWSIPGCPVNGPAVAAVGKKVVVAWYTYAQSQPRVRVAFSTDSGAHFGPAVDVDTGHGAVTPIGRVDVTIDEQGHALVSWMTSNREEGEVLVRRISFEGKLGPSVSIARMGRQAGLPRQERDGADAVLAWTDSAGVRLARVATDSLPVADEREAQPPAPAALAAPPRTAPQLEVRTLEGDPASLVKFQGRVVLVNFWATWCEPCRMELPVLSGLEGRHRARGLAVVGVSVDSSQKPSEVRAFASRKGVTFALWHDPQERLAKAFGVQALPASFLVDRAGNVVWSTTGAIAPDAPDLAEAIERALAK